MKGKILIVATLDTKGPEAGFLKELVESKGHIPVMLDCGVMGKPTVTPDISREEVAREAGTTIKELLENGDKIKAIETMAEGARRMGKKLYDQGELHAVLSMGGIQGTVMGATVMQALPFGVPKVIVSAIANGQASFGPFVGTKDVTIIHSVADILGLNKVTRKVLAEGAGAVVGMLEMEYAAGEEADKTVALTSAGVTTPCANKAREFLTEMGYEMIAFHCNGIGAKAMEELVEQGQLQGILDMSPHDINDYLWGGIMPAWEGRMKATCRLGLPQVISTGCADIILYGPHEAMPDEIKKRKHYIHNPVHTHVKANYEEMLGLGRFIGSRLRDTKGWATVMVPGGGYSQQNIEGGVIWEPESDKGFVDGVAQEMDDTNEKVTIKVLDMHINDPEFARALVDEMHRLIQKS
ncbi:MAG: Tm-1-like ATP-binding domain-containing protein [Deltaproteobacteria bacterium]|nr:Tm-1-like ATP-binding domain-containing protein [Deltaproteobacteria bacterium]